MEIVTINSRADATSHAHLLQFDSTYGTWNKTIEAQEKSITINGRVVHVSRVNSPEEITWDAW
jgi:glyceraldehyde 3-phosphate dehydrogenase